MCFLFVSQKQYVLCWFCAQVHYPPYLFEAFLSEPVDEDRSTAKVGNGVAVITLPKCSNAFWEHLVITTCRSKPFPPFTHKTH